MSNNDLKWGLDEYLISDDVTYDENVISAYDLLSCINVELTELYSLFDTNNILKKMNDKLHVGKYLKNRCISLLKHENKKEKVPFTISCINYEYKGYDDYTTISFRLADNGITPISRDVLVLCNLSSGEIKTSFDNLAIKGCEVYNFVNSNIDDILKIFSILNSFVKKYNTCISHNKIDSDMTKLAFHNDFFNFAFDVSKGICYSLSLCPTDDLNKDSDMRNDVCDYIRDNENFFLRKIAIPVSSLSPLLQKIVYNQYNTSKKLVQ